MKRPLPKGTLLHSERAQGVFKGIRWTIFQWPQKLFNGKTTTFESIKRNDSVIVIPVIDDKIVLVKERQPHVGEYLGFCAGGVEDEEDLEIAARRELREETGMVFKNMIPVHVSDVTPGVEWFAYTFVATGYEKTIPTQFDDGMEDIETMKVSIDRLLKLTKSRAFRYSPRFIENFIIQGKEKQLAKVFKNPEKYRIE